ncbi:MAG: methyltransferase domain-containing protein [Armatimonadetes bacterium]|nr:methyltransferase domain-containing protein [Armatimonadota bacterium]
MPAPNSRGVESRSFYDLDRHPLGQAELARLRERNRAAAGARLWRWVGHQPGMRTLDAGCGPGHTTEALAADAHPAEVVGIDFGERILAVAESVRTASPLKNFRFVQGDIGNLPLAEGSFDFVWMQMVLQHLADPQAALREACRVLQGAGRLGIMEAATAVPRFYPPEAELEAYFREAARAQREYGADPEIAGRLEEMVRRAGFARCRSRAIAQAASGEQLAWNLGYLRSRGTMAGLSQEAVERAAGALERAERAGTIMETRWAVLGASK